MTPYLTPYSAATPDYRRTKSLCARRKLNTGRPHAGRPERTGNELENRSGVRATGGSNPSPSAPADGVRSVETCPNWADGRGDDCLVVLGVGHTIDDCCHNAGRVRPNGAT